MEFLNNLQFILIIIQKSIAFIGVLVILTGVIVALVTYLRMFSKRLDHFKHKDEINQIRLLLGKRLILGLEFIVAADLIGTTTTPDYYSVGILGAIVLIRTVLTFSLTKEIQDLSKEKN